jgi:hypothetical protein
MVALAAALAATTAGAAARSGETRSVTWTGWLSDQQCARVNNGETKPNNTLCVKKCLEEGSPAVFISEQAKAIYVVKDHPTVSDDVGYHLELTGTVDEAAKTIAVTSVKRLAEVVNVCGVKKQ